MNYYQVLEVNKNASQSAIKVAFKRLAVKYHPDKNPGSKWAETRFKEINNAYQVLSDPDKRANYDYKLSMGYASTPSTTPASRTPTYQYRRQRNVYRHRHWQYAREKNRLANIWAFGILGGITLVYLIIFGINYKLKSMAEEKMLNADEAVIQAARIKFDAGVFGEALAILDQHLQENSNRFRVMDIKKDYLKKVTASGYEKFYKQDYNSALRMFKLVYLYNAQQTVDFYDKIAKSSKKVGNYKDAAEAYEFITRKNPENLNAHLEAGILYNYNLKNYEKALIYFQKARELTIKDYINEYGKGFVLVFKPEQIPDSHYLVYCGLGMASHKLAMNHQASEALDWAILLRPNRPEAYYLKGVIFEDSGYPALACKNWNLAYHHGMEEAGRLAALNCPI